MAPALRPITKPTCRLRLCILCVCFLLLSFLEVLQAQDVKVEYNKSEEFSRFKTYSWITNEPYTRPFLALHIKGSVDEQLQSEGIRPVEQGADLVISAYGALEDDMSVSFDPGTYVLPGLEGPVWWTTGAVIIPGNSTAVFIKKGTLVVDVADTTGKTVENGVV
jgi:hypothetical protein